MLPVTDDETYLAELDSILPTPAYWVEQAEKGEIEKIQNMVNVYSWPNCSRLRYVLTDNINAFFHASVRSGKQALISAVNDSYQKFTK